MELTLRSRFGPGADPEFAQKFAQYEVIGLPPRHVVWIGRGNPHVPGWQMNRMTLSGAALLKGHWTGNYESAEAALEDLQKNFGKWLADDIHAILERVPDNRRAYEATCQNEWSQAETLVRADRVLQFRAFKYALNRTCNNWADETFVEGFLRGSEQTKDTMLTEFAAACPDATIDGRPVVDVLKDIADRIDLLGMIPESRRQGARL